MTEKDEIISQLVKCLDLDELLESLARKSLIVDSQIEALKGIQNEMFGLLGEMRQELDQFRKDRSICGHLNLLMDHKDEVKKSNPTKPELNNNDKSRENDETKLIDKLLQ